MKHRVVMVVVALSVAASAQAQQPTSDDVLSGFLRRSYAAFAKDLVAAVAMMPAEDFGFRPAGAVKDVRTFGEIVTHLVTVNAFVCSMGDGKPDPTASIRGDMASLPTDKARLTAMIDETNARCTAYLASLTDATLAQVVTTGAEPHVLQSVRGNAVMFAIAHSNEHYGNLVTYLRAKGLVPPATPAQASFLAPAKPIKTR